MRFGKRQPLRRYIYSKFGIASLLLCALLLGRSVYERYSIEREMAARQVEAASKLEDIEARRTELKEDVAYLEGERGIEEEIRNNFDVARPGEQVVILTGEAATTTEPETPPESPRPWWRWWR